MNLCARFASGMSTLEVKRAQEVLEEEK